MSEEYYVDGNEVSKEEYYKLMFDGTWRYGQIIQNTPPQKGDTKDE